MENLISFRKLYEDESANQESCRGQEGSRAPGLCPLPQTALWLESLSPQLHLPRYKQYKAFSLQEKS